MVRLALIILMSLGSLLGFSQESITSKNFEVAATVSNIQNNNGMVYYALYESQNAMTARKPIQFQRTKIKHGTATVTFENISNGVYAMICYHDANDNGQMDFGDTGRPIEDYGTSNGSASFGPPRFEDAKFEVSNTNLTFEIKF